MKNLPYFKGGTCKNQEIHISFKGILKELEFVDFEDFCNKADKILYIYTKYKNEINLVAYKNYIYSKKFSNDMRLDNAMKEKCFEWVISIDYENISKNDLYSLLGKQKKGKL